MATLSHMQLRLNSLDARVTTELFRDAHRHRLNVFIDGKYRGYLAHSTNAGRFVFWQDGWQYHPEYTPTQFEQTIRIYLVSYPIH